MGYRLFTQARRFGPDETRDQAVARGDAGHPMTRRQPTLPPHEQKWFRRKVVLGEDMALWRIESEFGTLIANVPISDNPNIDAEAIARRIAPEEKP